MSKRGLPNSVQMRHDAHYVEELSRTHRSVGKIIPIGRLEPNPQQPRVEIGDLTELTASIKQNGVLEPLLVKPHRSAGTWLIIAGERRWRAANLAGLTEVPCIEMDLDDQTVAEIALIENLQRKDLTVWEEADGLKFLCDKFGYTHDEIAQKISKSRTTVTESMAIAGLPPDIREKCRRAGINAKSTLLEIARQFDAPAMHEFLDRIGARNLKRDEIRRQARPAKERATRPDSIAAPAEQFEPGAAGDDDDNRQRRSFEFAAEDQSFTLEIKFSRADVGKTEVLKALKQIFERVKNHGLQ